jgi:hypothetical protein
VLMIVPPQPNSPSGTVFKVALRARGINVINITPGGKLLRSICVVKNSSNLNQN